MPFLVFHKATGSLPISPCFHHHVVLINMPVTQAHFHAITTRPISPKSITIEIIYVWELHVKHSYTYDAIPIEITQVQKIFTGTIYLWI